ncbi:hypothetical protein KC320_g283 [Hortaea werneckii]|nr:hypothetical protein KC320_g283 [Hortaea werneckii]
MGPTGSTEISEMIPEARLNGDVFVAEDRPSFRKKRFILIANIVENGGHTVTFIRARTSGRTDRPPDQNPPDVPKLNLTKSWALLGWEMPHRCSAVVVAWFLAVSPFCRPFGTNQLCLGTVQIGQCRIVST